MASPSHISPIAQEEKLRILFVEDNPDDLELILLELQKANLEVAADIVMRRDEFIARISAVPYDAVIADYKLDGWTGMDALALMREQGRRLPFILVTGVLGEDFAVDCIKQGASDYVLKDRLARLPVAIRRSIKESCLQEQQEQANGKLPLDP